MQEKHRSYNGSAIQRRAQRYIGRKRTRMGDRNWKWYVVQILYTSLTSPPTRLNLTRRWMLVTIVLMIVLLSFASNLAQRGEHAIDDELVFSNHTGYVFHDSLGIESGSTKELATLRNFIRRKCGENKLRDKLHAIWFALPFPCL